jgi:hypothetical protein
MDSYESVAKLDTPALRALFDRGRPEQRVWAIWVLALRTGGLTANGTNDPDAGVRRTMAVMLAAHGELDVLVALAQSDPSRLVRESAMQIVTRIAAQGKLDGEIVLECARRDPPVRGAILAAIDRGAPPFLVELALGYLRSGDPSEQGEAFEALMRTELPDANAAALEWVQELPDARVRDACTRMLKVLGEWSFACAIARGYRRLRRIAIAVMHRPQWASVEQLIGDDRELLYEILREGRVDVPATVVARAALDGFAQPLVERLTAGLAIIDSPSDELRPLLPLLDEHYGTWIAALERDDEHDDWRARRAARKELVKLRRQIQRLMAI